MPRTTIDIDASILREVRRLARTAHKSIGDVVSELLAVALRRVPDRSGARPEWQAKAMRSRIDLEDKDAVYETLDGR